MTPTSGRRAGLVAAISEQLQLIRPDAEQIAADCAGLRPLLGRPPDRGGLDALRRLCADLAAADAGTAAATPLLALLADVLPDLVRPWALLTPLITCEDDDLAAAALAMVADAVAAGRLELDRGLLRLLARRLPGGGSDGAHDPVLAAASRLLGDGAGARPALEDILAADRDPQLRSLAARLLDLGGDPAPPALARRLLGDAAWTFLAPYLDYTRAGCSDLLALVGGRRLDPAVVPSLQAAQERWGAPLVRQLVTALGWAGLNRGLEVRHRVEVTIPGHLPLMVPPEQAELLAGCGDVATGPARLLVVARGATAVPARRRSGARDPVDRFRVLNTTHAELLVEILDVAPLVPEKVQRILAAMDRIVSDYVALFATASEECAILPGIYADLRGRVLAALQGWRDGQPLPAELTRLVQMFEDPPNVGAVRTIHGLKRYLHQKGLKLGFALVDTAQTPNRSVDLVLVDRRGRLLRAPTIRFAEFEAAAEPADPGGLPYPVRLVVEGWARALLYGRTSFPDVSVFLFGNEVQYYVFFRNHPVFLRIDFSPPQRGGMIDLEYYGVSGYELDVHPNPELDAIRRFFADLEFDVGLDGVRLHLRYDKERCPDLGDLCAKATALFRLAPWLMELDWLVGSLALGAEGRELLTAAWSERFRRSGVLPERDLLTADRRGILRAVEPGPTGPLERRWDGAAPYADRFTGPPPPGFAAALRAVLEQRQLLPPSRQAAEEQAGLGLLELEDEYLAPLARAEAAGRLVRDERGRLVPADPHLVQVLHEAERFAELLADGGPAAAAAIGLARPVAELERFVDFTVTGSVGGLTVQRAVLPVRGGRLTVFALRDAHGLVRMGLFTSGERLLRRRSRRSGRWRVDGGADAARLWSLLRGANYVAGSVRPAGGDPDVALAELRGLADAGPAAGGWRPGETDKVLGGLKAAPGRAVGRAVFGTRGRRPEDLAAAVLVAREVTPADNPFLHHCAGVVSTGGAVLSHAALLAIQFGKPALLAAARWDEGPGRQPALRFVTMVERDLQRVVHGYDVRVRAVLERRADELRAGDLVVLDADEGMVCILGQDRDALGLHDGLRLLGEAAAQAAAASRDDEVIAARAQHLRARHQVNRILERLTDPALAGFAVEELVAGADLVPLGVAERTRLLERLLANPAVAAAAGARLADLAVRLAARAAATHREARAAIPRARLVAEVVGWRLRARRAHQVHAAGAALLDGCGLGERPARGAGRSGRPGPPPPGRALERPACGNWAAWPHPGGRRPGLAICCDTWNAAPWSWAGRRRRCRSCTTGSNWLTRRSSDAMPSPWCCRRRSAASPCSRWWVGRQPTWARCGSWPDADVCPPWFVVTDRAFAVMMDQPVGGGTLRSAIAAAWRSRDRIRSAARPASVPCGATRRCRSRCRTPSWPPMPNWLLRTGGPAAVAIRSSSCDEDTEAAMRAGEFETYLNVRGEGALLDHLRLTWAGLWSAQAIHSRAAGAGVRRLAQRRPDRAAPGRVPGLGRGADGEHRPGRSGRAGGQRGPGPGRGRGLGHGLGRPGDGAQAGRRPPRRGGPAVHLPDHRQAAAGGARRAPRQRHAPGRDPLPPAAAPGPGVRRALRAGGPVPGPGTGLRLPAGPGVRGRGGAAVAAAGPAHRHLLGRAAGQPRPPSPGRRRRPSPQSGSKLVIRKQDSLEYHAGDRPGKIGVTATKPCLTPRELRLAYLPGATFPAEEIARDRTAVFKYTSRGNLVGVITDGTAVPGLGDVGPYAAKPMQEGIAILFKRLADIDVFDLELEPSDLDGFVAAVRLLEPTFGGINLKDISAPRGLEMYDRLREVLEIPVYHENLYSTAVVAAAALINALELADKRMDEVRVVICGAGTVGIGCARLLRRLGVAPERLLMYDVDGLVHPDDPQLHPYQREFAVDSPLRSLDQGVAGSDVFIGASAGGVFTMEMIRSMSRFPVVFALATPEPEIGYEDARAARQDVIVATGLGPDPNAVLDVLSFPYIFRGALDVQSVSISEGMMLAAARALAELAREEVPEEVELAYGGGRLAFGPEYLLPKPIDPRIFVRESAAVAAQAVAEGLAAKPVPAAEYEGRLSVRLGTGREKMRELTMRARRSCPRVVFSEGTSETILRACGILLDEGIARPILLGPAREINRRIDALGLDLAGAEIVDPARDPRFEAYAEEYFRMRRRQGVIRAAARERLRQPDRFGAMMVHMGHADLMIAGASTHFTETLQVIIEVIGPAPGISRISSHHLALMQKEVVLLADCAVNVEPTAEQLAETALLAATTGRALGLEPRVAMLSFSNFGSNDHEAARRVRRAVAIAKERAPDLELDGDMQLATARGRALREELFPFAELTDDANVLVFPDLQAGALTMQSLHNLVGAVSVGPLLMGTRLPVHLVQYGATVEEVVNLTTVGVVEAMGE